MVFLAVLGGAAFAAAPANGARVTWTQMQLVYHDGQEEFNNLTVTADGARVDLSDPGIVVLPAGGTYFNTTLSKCTFRFGGANCARSVSINVFLGARADVVHVVGSDPVSLHGGPGPDRLFGGGGRDLLSGAGNADELSGGAGTDSASYFESTGPVTVTIDDVANDGIAGEGDNVRSDVEDVVGSSHDDALTGSSANNSLSGQSGSDVLQGLEGNDRLDGGRGSDLLEGQDGDDLITSGFDLKSPDVVHCGAGVDVARVDITDQVAADCETVQIIN